MSEIQWECNYCKKPVQDGTGYIYIDSREADIYDKAVAEWKAGLEKDGKTPVMSIGDLKDGPELPAWIITHGECDSAAVADPYLIEIHRIRTPSQVIHWTAHLMGKTWTRSTDWQGLLNKVPLDRAV